MKTRWLFWIFGAIALVSVCLTSCDRSDGDARMKVRLIDAPLDVEAVYVDVQEVRVHIDSEGWIVMDNINAGVYNLLEFTNGNNILLVDKSVPEGELSQMRLVLGSNNSITVDGSNHPLTVPSGSSSGFKINIHQTLEADKTYEVWLDFDASQSVHQTGNGEYMLKPVIRGYLKHNTGEVIGEVKPPDAKPHIYIETDLEVVGTLANSEGRFYVGGIYPDNIIVRIEAEGYQTVKIENVNVSIGKATDIGIIQLVPSGLSVQPTGLYKFE